MFKKIIIIFGLLLPVQYALAAVYDVDINNAGCSDVGGTPYCSVQAAINASATDDTINIFPGTYTESLTINFKGLTLVGAGQTNTILSGGGVNRVLFINGSSSLNVYIIDLAISNGFVGSGTVGAGIYNGGVNLSLTSVVVNNNQSGDDGGGIYSNGTGKLAIANSSVINNTAGMSGGGLVGSNITILDSTVANNTAVVQGGGIYNITSSTLVIVNSTVSGNRVDTRGGGIRNEGNTYLYNSTVTNNVANYQNLSVFSEAGGIDSNVGGANVTLNNTILAGNRALQGAGQDCIGSSMTSVGYNIIGISDGCGLIAAFGDLVGTESNPVSARIGELADNGGTTLTHQLMTKSYAINHGNPTGCAWDDVVGGVFDILIGYDQRGELRPGVSNIVQPRCDIGAYEYNAKSADIIVDFGAIGLWARMNDSSWQKLNNSSPDDVVTGDVDGNGIDDVIADFDSTLGGIYIKRNGGAWVKLHNSSPQGMVSGDLDGNGSDDIVIDFGGIGLWARMNDSSWLKLNNNSPDNVITGDIDGNGKDDVIADFGSTIGGIYIKRNGGDWSKLHNTSPQGMVAGDLNGNAKDDIVIDFGAIGLWARMNDSVWLKLSNTSPDSIVSGDVDGNGADDVIASFGSTMGGLWQKRNLGGWVKVNNNAPDQMIMGDMDLTGQSDLIGAFNSSIGGVYVRRNNSAWTKLHSNNPEDLAVGSLDGT